MLAEAGDELIRHFELDAFQLEAIINGQVDPKDQVERHDIALLAMTSLREDYLRMRLNEDGQVSTPTSANSLRRYLYDKYIHGAGSAHSTDATGASVRVEAIAPQPTTPRTESSTPSTTPESQVSP